MIARAIRFTERFSYFLLKLFAGVGRRFQTVGSRISRRLERDRSPSEPDIASVQSRVQALSRLVVLLLATVVLLVVWSGSGSDVTNPVVQLLIGSGPAEPNVSAAPQPAPDTSGGPAPISSTLNTGGTILFAMDAGGQFDLFALSPGASEVTRLTNNPADDRFPVWSPDGTRIAFSSTREGNWDLYTLDVASGNITRLTNDLAYEGEPNWSPDSQFLIYEAYYNRNYDVNVVRADGTEPPSTLTVHPSPDTSPAWTTDSTSVDMVYASWRDGNQELYLVPLDASFNELRARNLTNTPNVNEDNPVWNATGDQIAYQAQEEGATLIYTLDVRTQGAAPQVVGQGRSPAWAADGEVVIFLADRDGYSLLLSETPAIDEAALQAFQLPSYAYDLSWGSATLPATPAGELAFARTEPIPAHYAEDFITDRVSEDPPYRVRRLVGLENAFLADTVDISFAALRQRMLREAGWDFLGNLDSTLWTIDFPAEPGQDARNWHMTGRAFSFDATTNEGDPPRVEIVPRQDGIELYWDVYVRTEVQDGSLGMPLDELPWDLYARFSGDREAYEAGGAYKRQVPSGYYVNFTRIAREYGWQPTPADSSWYYNWPGILFWQYEKRDGLTWEQAMRQVWSTEDLSSRGLAAPIPVNPTPANPAP